MKKVISLVLAASMLCSSVNLSLVFAVDAMPLENENTIVQEQQSDEGEGENAAPTQLALTQAVADTCTCDTNETKISLADAVSDFSTQDCCYVMTSGYYYLEADYELAKGLLIPSGVTVTLCLNDHILSMGENDLTGLENNEISDSIIVVYGGTLTLTDCGTTARYWDGEKIVEGSDVSAKRKGVIDQYLTK